MSAAAALIGLEEISAEDLAVVFVDEHFVTGGEPICRALAVRNGVSLAFEEDGFDDAQNLRCISRNSGADQGSPAAEHSFEELLPMPLILLAIGSRSEAEDLGAALYAEGLNVASIGCDVDGEERLAAIGRIDFPG